MLCIVIIGVIDMETKFMNGIEEWDGISMDIVQELSKGTKPNFDLIKKRLKELEDLVHDYNLEWGIKGD